VRRRALAAAVTPLRQGGEALDEDAFGPYADFLAASGVDGIFALGTTGEGVLLGLDERRRAAERFLEAAAERLGVVVHCGAQTTADTVALCEHAAALEPAGVAVVAPPYYAFDDRGLLGHFSAAARACEPVPFYVYEFAARSGYAVPVAVVERLREEASNLAGMKVSDAPFERVEPYLLEGLDVFVGAEALVPAGLARGAAGAVSGLAAVFPEPVVELVREPTEHNVRRTKELRDALEASPFIPAAKRALVRRGIPLREDVRAPFVRLSRDERAHVDRTVADWLESSPGSPARRSPPSHPRRGDQASPTDSLLAAGGTLRVARSGSAARKRVESPDP
jgi:dihydrodipicolinate synthase/N-acetylneuraminate lyase